MHDLLSVDAQRSEQVHALRYYGSVQSTLPTNPLVSTTLYQSAPVADWFFVLEYHRTI